jgi:4'-phosphopantetheinyl transferase EntD
MRCASRSSLPPGAPGPSDGERGRVIERILPPGVASAEAAGDVPGAELFPEEEAALGRAVAERRREFASGRACARRALAELGVVPGPIGSGARGEPVWPKGVVGSITHCRGLRACAVGRVGEVRAIGIDAEPREPLPPGVLATVASAGERRALAAAGPGELCLDRVLFSAKEAVYKAWFPLARRGLGFEDAELSLSVSQGTFRAALLVPGPTVGGRRLSELRGRWLVAGEHVLTAVVVSA